MADINEGMGHLTELNLCIIKVTSLRQNLLIYCSIYVLDSSLL